MCQLELDTDYAWRKWRATAIQLGGLQGNKYGYQLWRSPYVVSVRATLYDHFQISRNIFGRPKLKFSYYIHHPHSFIQVNTTGVQTAEDDLKPADNIKVNAKGDKNDSAGITPLMKDVVLKNNINFYTLKLRAEQETEKIMKDLLRNASLDDQYNVTLKQALHKRLCVMSAGDITMEGQRTTSPDSDEIPRKCSSWCEVDSAAINKACADFDTCGDSTRDRCTFAVKVDLCV